MKPSEKFKSIYYEGEPEDKNDMMGKWTTKLHFHCYADYQAFMNWWGTD